MMEKMNIAFVSNVVYPFVKGGAEKRIYEIGTRLADRGHQITVYGRHFWDGPKESEYEGIRLSAVAPEADLYTGDRRSISEAIEFSLRLAPKLRTMLTQRDHDLIVASVFPYFPILSTSLSRIGKDTPMVTTWHEVWGSYWDEYLDRFSLLGKLTERITANVPQYPVAISDVTAQELSGLGVNQEQIKTIPNGIDTERVRSAPLPDEGFDVLFAGRLIEHKNVDLVLRAFDSVANNGDKKLGIIGDGPQAESLKSRAETLDSEGQIKFTGFLDNYSDVLGHMRRATVFVSPSVREGFGITFLEAMAADCTVIAADHQNSAASEVIGDSGFLTSPNADSVTLALEKAVNGERPQNEPTRRADNYDWDNITDTAAQSYRQAINRDWV